MFKEVNIFWECPQYELVDTVRKTYYIKILSFFRNNVVFFNSVSKIDHLEQKFQFPKLKYRKKSLNIKDDLAHTSVSKFVFPFFYVCIIKSWNFLTLQLIGKSTLSSSIMKITYNFQFPWPLGLNLFNVNFETFVKNRA